VWAVEVRSKLKNRFHRLLQDRSGSYELIQFVLILPILVTILYGSFELMKLASARQTLEAATYQAARYLSAYHKTYANARYNRPGDDRLQAERLIWESLLSNPYIASADNFSVIVRYYNGAGREIASPVEFSCESLGQYVSSPSSLQLFSNNLVFTVRTWVTIPWKSSVLGLSLGDVTLSSSHTSFVDCGPWYPPYMATTPTPSPTPSGAPHPAG
jgi:Flp pilus assembly protein TadG